MAVDLAVVIVTWNVRDVVAVAIQSLLDDLATCPIIAEIYVVDSASTDGTVEMIQTTFPQIKLIISAQNLGFGTANNWALRQIGFGQKSPQSLPKAVYLLNPDTITHQGATQTLYNALFSDPKIGLVGAALNYGDGSFQHAAFSFPGLRQLWVEFFPTPGRLFDSPFNGRYSREKYSAQQPFAVDFVLGATMMLKTEVVQQTGMFDERFFMYCEEIDWAWRIHRAGWEVYCVPSAHVTHLGGQSSSQARPRTLKHLWQSRLLLFDRYFVPLKRVIARKMVAYGIQSKLRQLPLIPDLTESDRTALADAYNSIYEMASK